ncbi:coiled-coil domain-containing protein 25 [Ceratocystis lukuohia]|uniref:Coiled-coil domain-containing protein 25 n=1 Tax=Ceratocystis lukuohia TaxID=2019550 RepID=A0ABR4MIG3_9PEZI
MVYYFTSKVVDPPANIYVGKDKFENEDLIAYGWDEDVCVPTDSETSKGNKKDNITIIYTPWANLHKDGSMATGQVSFKDARKVRRILVPARENAIINRLNKTRIERLAPELDLAAEKDERLKELRRLDRIAAQARRKEELRLEKEYKEKKWQKEHAYDDLFSEEGMEASSNANRTEDWEDDFM